MLIPIRNLGQGGVVATEDFPSSDLPINGVTFGVNVNFRDGKVLKTTGFETVFPVDGGEGIGDLKEFYWFDSWSDTNGIFAAFGVSNGSHGFIYTSDDGATLTRAVIEDANGDPAVLSPSTTWQMEIFGPYIIVNNGVDAPLYNYSLSSGVWTFRPIPGWGAANSPGGAVRSIRTYKNYLIAIGVADTPYTVYWSDLGDVENLPSNWDYADTTTQAGRNPLQTDDGVLVDGEHLNDRFMLFQDNAAVSLEYVGGGGVFSFRTLFSYGIVGLRAAQSFENQQLFVSKEAIYIHDGSSLVRPADAKVQKRFYREVSDVSKVFVAKDVANHEVFILYPVDGSPFPNRILKLNWKEGSWTFEDPEDEIRCLDLTSRPSSALDWGDLTGSWGSLTQTWAQLGRVVRELGLFHLTAKQWQIRGTNYSRPGDSLRRITSAYTDARALTSADTDVRALAGLGPPSYYAYIERTFVDLDDVKQEAASVMMVRSVYPQIVGQGKVDFQFGVSRTTHDGVEWGDIDTLDLDAEQDRAKIDLRLAGRYLHWRMGSWQGLPHIGNWQLSGMDIDVQRLGVR